MIKLVLMFPPGFTKSPYAYSSFSNPLALTTLAAYIQTRFSSDEVDIKILQCEVDDAYETMIETYLAESDKIVFGFSVNAYTYKEALRLAEKIKKLEKNAIIVFGGVHPSHFWKQILEKHNNLIDVCVVGAGEEALEGILAHIIRTGGIQGLTENIPNIAFYKSENIIRTAAKDISQQVIDSIPTQPLELLDLEKYAINIKDTPMAGIYGINHGFIYVNASRGCPNRCVFCSIPCKNVIFRSPEKVMEEMFDLHSKFNLEYFIVQGENLNITTDWLASFASLLPDHPPFRWGAFCMNNQVGTDSFFMGLKAKGLDSILMGFETGDESILKNLGKPGGIKRAAEVANMACNAGIKLCGTLMLGNPGETQESINNTIEFIKPLPFKYIEISVFTPLPGTKIFAEIMKNKKISFNEWDEIDFAALIEEYVKEYTGVTMDIISSAMQDIKERTTAMSAFERIS